MNVAPKTKKELATEILNCGRSPSYFLKKYGMIQHPTRGLIPFATFGYQDDLLKAFDQHRFDIILKSRQVGITTLIAGYIAWMLFFYQDKNVLVVATKQQVAMNMIRVIKIIFKNLPSWFNLAKISIDNKQSIELNNGSRVKATTTASDAGRSEALSLLVVDEAAFIRNFEQVWIGLWPTLSRGGRAIISSTPNGVGNLFHKLYQQAQNNENQFNCRFGTYINPNKTEEIFNDRLMWWVHPENDQKWFENETRGKSRREIAQEYECSFVASGDTFIFSDDLQRLDKQIREPVERTNFDRNLWIWKYPVRGATYLISCLPEKEKILTNNGLRHIEDVSLKDKLIDAMGNLVSIKNKQITPNWNGNLIELKLSNNFRTTKFTDNHPIWASEGIVKRNYLQKHPVYRFNERYWEFDFKFTEAKNLKEGDWIEFPNFYRKNILSEEKIIEKWKYENDTRVDFRIDKKCILEEDFWWYVGMWLAEGWVYNNSSNFTTIFTAHNTQKEKYIIDKIKDIAKRLFNREGVVTNKGNNCTQIQFNSKEFGVFLTENFGKYAKGKQIPEWVKFLPDNLKLKLVEGYLLGDGCWLTTSKININNNIHVGSKMSFVSISLELLEGIQDILFSLGVLSSLTLLRKEGSCFIRDKKESHTQETYQLNLAHFDSVQLADLLNWKHEYRPKNKRIISNCFLSKDLEKIYFKIKKINKIPYQGTVYNFETETHTFCAKNIVTHNCDISRGDSRDFSGFHILRIDDVKLEQCGEYKGKITPDILGDVLVEASKKYNNAIIAVENNGGWAGQTILKIRQANYPFIYYASRNKREFIDPYYAQFADQRTLDGVAVPGYSVTPLNRIPMLAKMEQYVRLEQIQVYSSRLLDEFRTFSWNNSRPEAQKGYHDDLVMSLAGGIWVREESFMNVCRGGNNMNQAMLAGISVEQTTTRQIPQFNFNQSGIYDRSRIAEFVQEQNKIILGSGESESLNWLLDKKIPIFKG